ncbi:uncharacterized protein LOC134749653 [Cydia strobilella]|uniref:uncharacterized protein LOC134749653 n=1 Tax=Cydia strobilella TaxID=1100964 RepID=UPI0030045D7A
MNLSYADDMVLLTPAMSALKKLLKICETYAESHGLRYNAKKTELLMFRPQGGHVGAVPPAFLSANKIKRVSQFKYLGHWLTDDLSDGVDVERERRALAVKCNMLGRRFARCTKQVKISLFKAYCQSFYTCSLWVKYTQRTLNTIRVQYNNGFRMLMGLPRHCSASGMFAETRTDGFHAIIRKLVASLAQRVRGTNGILTVVSNRLDCPFQKHWMELHVRAPIQSRM